MSDMRGGGPAFPTDAYYDEKRYAVIEGMTLRDYFAAHAPTKPQSWFEPAAPDRPAFAWDHDHSRCGDEDSTRMPWDCIPTNKQEVSDWEVELEKQRRLQWPWAWADEILKARTR